MPSVLLHQRVPHVLAAKELLEIHSLEEVVCQRLAQLPTHVQGL